MKAKKILFKIAGILQFICCGFLAFVGGVLLLLRPIVNVVIDGAYEEFQKLSTENAESIDKSMEFLLDYSKEEFIEYFSKGTLILALVTLLIAIVGILFGVFFIKCSRRYEYILAGNKSKKIWVGVLSAIFCGLTIPTVLVIIALSLKDNSIDNINSPVVEINN